MYLLLIQIWTESSIRVYLIEYNTCVFGESFLLRSASEIGNQKPLLTVGENPIYDEEDK